MIVGIQVDLIYVYQDINLFGKNKYKDKRYSTENNCMVDMSILYDYSSLDYIKLMINVYIGSIIKNKPIIFNRNMIEKILDVVRDIYELFSQNKRLYHLNPTATIIIYSDNIKYFNFINDRMDIVDVIRINECYYNREIMFTYKCYLYESTIKWI